MFSDFLLTVDFDRTLTGPDSKIPQRNLEAIAYFMENGGSFTVNTGRSPSTFWKYLDKIPVNAPYLLYNGSAAWEKGQLTDLKPIDLEVWPTMETVHSLFPEMRLEIQGTQVHYLLTPEQDMVDLYRKLGWRYEIGQWGQDVGPFLKFALFGAPKTPDVGALYVGPEEELRRFDEAEQTIRSLYGDKVEVFRAAPRIIDVHAKGVSKLAAAKRLQEKLGKKYLVCVGDGENDVPMLDGADFAFCPADSTVANRYCNVCSCAEGAVAEVIYKKIPEIIAFNLDTAE